MKITQINFRNIFAYGEELQTINYSDNGELILLKGESGAGKSAILSLPCLLLYGKIEKTPKNSIANRANKNGFIQGHLEAHGHNYVIERGFLPNTLKVFKDGTDIESFGIKDAQTYIDSEIIDIPQVTFNNMISISMKKFKSFLSMSPSDRKQIIDRIFDLEIVNIIYEAVKKDTRELGNLINSDNAALFQVTKTLHNTEDEMKKLQERNRSSLDASKIESNKNLIASYSEQIQTCQNGYKEYYDKLSKVNQDIQAQRQTLLQTKNNISHIQEKINLFKQEKCPVCATPFNSENFTEIRNKLNNLIQEQQTLQTSINNKITELQTSYNYINEYLNKINQAMYSLQQKVAELNNENIKITANLKSSNEYQGIQNIITQTQEQIQLLTDAIKEKTEKMCNLEYLLQVYSIEGVKQQVINNYLPILNKEIAENLERLNFSYFLEFDSKFEPSLKDMGAKVPVETLSDGEMTRVDITVLCALFKLLKMRYPSINILSIDELVSFLDVNNSQSLLKLLKEFAVDLNLNIFVVSHVNIDTEYFDRCIEVTRGIAGFSQINEENLLQ